MEQIHAFGMEFSKVDTALYKALTDVLAGRMEVTLGTAAAAIANAIISVRRASELEKRLTALKDQSGWRVWGL